MSAPDPGTLGGLAVLLVVLPLLGAALVGGIAAFPRARRSADLLTVLVVIAELGGACWAVATARHQGAVTWLAHWTPRHGHLVGIAVVADLPALLVVLLVAALTLAALVYSWHFLEDTRAGYQVLMLALLGAITGFCLAGDIFNAFVWFELIGVAAYALTGMRVEEPRSVHGALTFGVVNTVGASFTLVGVALLYARTAQLNLAAVGEALRRQPGGHLVQVALVMLVAGVLVKLAIVPFHFWTADAEAVAPTPVCVLLSGAMVTAAAFALARWWWVVFDGALDARAVGQVLLVFGAVTAVLGAAMCTLQRHVKRLLAYSTVSHAGVMLCCVGVMSSEGLAALGLYAAGHALAKGALFLTSGSLLNRFGTVDEHRLHGRARGRWGTGLVFALGGLGLAGLPPFGTFAGKALLEEAGKETGHAWLLVVVVWSALLTSASVLRAGGRIWLGLGPRREDGQAEEEQKESKEPQERHRLSLGAPGWVLALLTVALATPPVRGAVADAAGTLVDRHGYVAAVLHGAALPVAAEPVPAVWHLSSVLVGVALTLAALLLAAAMTWPRVWAPLRVAGRVLRPPMRALHTVHRAHLGDYVSWLLVGVAVLGAAVLLQAP
ncbi:MAG TPA: proton-conducting transporter membrane subunit [Marmoricola sp.]|nr:proton-conducting transporter membrane subunit [Marmoricola sp.]